LVVSPDTLDSEPTSPPASPWELSTPSPIKSSGSLIVDMGSDGVLLGGVLLGGGGGGTRPAVPVISERGTGGGVNRFPVVAGGGGGVSVVPTAGVCSLAVPLIVGAAEPDETVELTVVPAAEASAE
jgi:hypothetical protein